MRKIKRPLAFLSAAWLLVFAVHMMNERALPGPPSRRDGGRSAHAEPRKHERPEPGSMESHSGQRSDRSRPTGKTEPAAGALPPSLAADRVFSALDPDVLALKLPADSFRIYQKIKEDFPDVDWTDIDASHQAFMNKRDEYPLNLSAEQREDYAAWLGEAEPVSRALIRLRAEAHGLLANGMENGRGYYIDGFREGVPVYMVTSNVGAATTTGASLVRWNPGFDPVLGATVNGSDIYVNINDHGTIYEHPEFQLPNAGGSRILVKEINDGGNRDHMTHVAGIAAAWGYNSSLQGMAPRVWIRALIQQQTSDITNYGMATPGQQTGETNPRTGNPQLKSVVGNTSLGTLSPYNKYDSSSSSYDTVLRDYPYYMHFASSGNSGGGYETLTGGFKMAKNMIGIGNVSEANRNSAGTYTGGGMIASDSSRGPTYDGRINPDFVAKGSGVYSTHGESGAAYMDGTSMASPNAAGSAALLMDYVRQRLPQQYLRSSTYRALLATTADDRGNPGPDYIYGWGILNIHAAAKIVRQQADNPTQRLIIEDSLSPNQTWTEAYYSDGTKPVRITIAWLDPAGTVVADRSSRVVNDLDLRLIDPSGTERRPYVMPFTTGQGETPAYSTSLYSANAEPGDNFTDPVEQVYIAAPAPGAYIVRVTHKGSLRGNQAQPFSVAASGLVTSTGVAPTTQVAFSEAVPQNGILSPGEEAVAAVNLVNYSRDAANNVVGRITTSDPDVTLLADTVSYGTLASNQVSGGDGNFRIRLASGASPRVVNLTLTLTSSSAGGPWTYPATCAYVNEAAITGYVRDGHGNPVAGATVSWTGTGTGQATSDANGFYTVSEVDGNYTLTASAPGYVSRSPVSLTVPPYVSRDLFLDYYDLQIPPDTLSMQAIGGQSDTASLRLTNTGTLPITWSIPTSGYRFTTSDETGGPAYAWNDISSTGTLISNMGDETNRGPFALGFTMPFYGQNFTSIRIHSNGWLSFTSSSTIVVPNQSLPSSSLPENLIAVLGRDMNPGAGGTVHYKQTDDDTFVVQFTNVPLYGAENASKKATFQVVLKRNGVILFYYSRVDDPELGLVGIQNSTKTSGLTIARNQAFLKPGLAVRIQSKPAWLGITPTSGTIAVGASATVTLSGNATGLDVGTYDANVFVVSNDAANPVQSPFVLFNVVSNQSTVHEWPTASGIVFGQSLSDSALSGGSASVEGSFAFDSPTIIPNAGSYSAAVTFTPTDTASYSSVGGIVTVEVDKATPVVSTWPTASAIQYGQYFSASILSGGSASVPGAFAFHHPAGWFNGQDSFTFRVNDGESNSAPATVSITIAGQQGTPESQPLEPNASRPWTPADLTTLAWYDAADVSTVTVENGAVSQWSDKSGNARHVAQSTSGRRPTVSDSTIAFDGTDDFLTRSGAFCYAAGSADFYVVAAATNGNARIIAENRSSADNPMYGFRIGTDVRMGAYVRADDGSELFNNTMSATNVFSRQTPNLYMWRDTGSNLSGRVAGGSSTNVGYSRSGKVMTLNQFTIGATGPRPNALNGLTFVNAGMNEIVITANLNDADRQKMEGYLAWKWNLHGNLPGDHPYKQSAPVIITSSPPVAIAQSVTVQPGTPTAITLSGSDPDDDPLTFEIVTPPAYGALTGTAPNLTYTPPTLPAVGTHDVAVVFTPADSANYHSVTGTVNVIVNGDSSPYAAWAAQYLDHDLSDPYADTDGDGLSNFHEFAFGLNPTNGSSNHPIVAPFDKASRSFSYTRRADSGLTYTICISNDLKDWEDLPLAQVTESVAENAEAGAETVEVTLVLPDEPENLFLRVKAD